MTRDELALETEYLDLLDRLETAKAKGDRAKLHEAKRAVFDFRVKWRTIREQFAAPGDGTAAPKTVAVKTKGH